jgi:hypothetical protein
MRAMLLIPLVVLARVDVFPLLRWTVLMALVSLIVEICLIYGNANVRIQSTTTAWHGVFAIFDNGGSF